MEKTLIFIHGLGLGPWIFEEHLTSHFRSRGYEVHTPLLPAHEPGSSRRDRESVTMDQCVDFITEYIDTHITGLYALVGMSMGAAVCQRYIYERHSPVGLRGVVLMSSPPPVNNTIYTLKLLRKLALIMPDAALDFFSGRTNKNLIYSGTSLEKQTPALINEYSSHILKGFLRLEYEIYFDDLISERKRYDFPIRVLAGEDDHLFPVEVAKSIADYYLADIDVLPGLGHMIPIEYHHERATKKMDSFLQEIFS